MKGLKNKHLRRIRNLIAVCGVWAVFLSVSTYAWFVGMKTVSVSSFDISIATTEGLFLSMDGKNWSYTLDAKNATAYTDNTNTWADDGLIPLSTIGEMSNLSSRMIMYEKGSLTTTKGGYRLLASKVDNSASEKKGYVAFDLFIKNLSGEAYYTANNELNEEAIYLNTDSKVTIASAGGVPNTGIENSVRVAFTQVGRVNAKTGENSDAAKKVKEIKNITDITCSDVAAGTDQVQVTGICRNAQIWEPNDTTHVQNAINWYATSCRTRSGEKTSVDASYGSTACSTVSTTNPVNTKTPTYAISRELGIYDYVDIYDGARYNTYGTNTDTLEHYLAAIKGKTGEALATAKQAYKLIEYPYFTDTMKRLEGTSRPTFMTLAPNSITKLRVYIYIEGQDIDNYDFASLGKKISVQFGFTKERYIAENVDYHGPALPETVTE